MSVIMLSFHAVRPPICGRFLEVFRERYWCGEKECEWLRERRPSWWGSEPYYNTFIILSLWVCVLYGTTGWLAGWLDVVRWPTNCTFYFRFVQFHESPTHTNRQKAREKQGMESVGRGIIGKMWSPVKWLGAVKWPLESECRNAVSPIESEVNYRLAARRRSMWDPRTDTLIIRSPRKG